MNPTFLTPDITWIVPESEMQAICQLWQGGNTATDGIYLNGDQLATGGVALQYDIFELVVTTQFTGLLWGNLHQESSHPQASPTVTTAGDAAISYAIALSFSPELVAALILDLKGQGCTLPQLVDLEAFELPQVSQLPSEFMVALLQIGRSPAPVTTAPQQIQTQNPVSPTLPNRPLELLLNNRLEQERILNNVTHRIYQNQDLMVTVRLALEQVQKLLRVDRLLVYQFDVYGADETERSPHDIPLNRVTFEVLDHEELASLSQYSESLSTQQQQDIINYFQAGNHLALNQLVDDGQLEFCLPRLDDLKPGDRPQSILTLPLQVDHQLWGLLVAHQCTTPRRWRKNEISFLYHVADYLAIAVVQARSYQQLQEQKSNLETLAQQRAKELEDALLSAQVASQSKREFIHIVSHELLTPLTSIIGLSNTLSYWSTPENAQRFPIEKQRSYLDSIHDSGVKLRNLLQDILDFSEVEAARTLLDSQEFSLKKFCLEVIAAFQELSHLQGLTLHFTNLLEPEQESFCADRQRLDKILSHLLANAIKFTSKGGEVTLTIWREGEGDVLFQIKDTGIGITPQQIPLLFEKFRQLEPSMSRSHDGAGLGLALVKQLVELHQGQVHVTSTPKEGSIFTVRIPYQHQRHDLLPSSGRQNRTGGTIVLVSQDEETATLICDVLTAMGYQVIWLIDGAIALGQISILHPNMVLLDTQQAEQPIERIIEKLQNSAQTQQIPVLLVGDRLPEQAWRQLQKRGFRAQIEKPIDTEAIINLINNHMAQQVNLFRPSSSSSPQ